MCAATAEQLDRPLNISKLLVEPKASGESHVEAFRSTLGHVIELLEGNIATRQKELSSSDFFTLGDCKISCQYIEMLAHRDVTLTHCDEGKNLCGVMAGFLKTVDSDRSAGSAGAKISIMEAHNLYAYLADFATYALCTHDPKKWSLDKRSLFDCLFGK